MASLKDAPLRIPDQWSATWFRQFVVEVLAKADVRNAQGVGVTITSDGNSVATLSTDAEVTAALEAHDVDPFAHENMIIAHDTNVAAHTLAFDAHNIDLAAHANLIAAHDADEGAHAAAIGVHAAATDPHPDLIDDLTAATSVAESDTLMVSQSGANKRATVDQLAVAVFGEEWDDMLTVGTGINPPGAAADPTRNTTTGLLDFSGTADNVIVGEWQMSHQWKPGVVKPHIHLRFPTSVSANTRWKFEYDVASVNNDFVNNSGTLTTLATITIANPQNVKKHVVGEFGALDLSAHRESCVILWRITRLANSDAADTETSAVELLSVDLHYQKNKAGTEAEFPT